MVSEGAMNGRGLDRVRGRVRGRVWAGLVAGVMVLSLGALAGGVWARQPSAGSGAGATSRPGQDLRRGDAQQRVRLPEGVRVLRDLAYVEGGSRAQRLDLYLPAPRADKSPVPVMVWFHGGGWTSGSKDRPGAAMWLLARGYAVASVEYRFATEAVYPAQAHDAKAAVRYLRARAAEHGLDAERFVAGGTSAGGHLALVLGLSAGVKELEGTLGHPEQDSSVRAVLNMYGPTDLREEVVGRAAPVVTLLGGAPGERPELARLASPVAFVSERSVPVITLHGEADRTVPVELARRLDAAMSRAGAKHRLIVLSNAGHGGPQFGAPEHTAVVERFLADAIE